MLKGKLQQISKSTRCKVQAGFGVLILRSPESNIWTEAVRSGSGQKYVCVFFEGEKSSE